MTTAFELSDAWRGPRYERRVQLQTNQWGVYFSAHAYSAQLRAFAAALHKNPIYVLDEGSQIVGYGLYSFKDEPDQISMVAFNRVLPETLHSGMPSNHYNANLGRGLTWVFAVFDHHGIEWDPTRRTSLFRTKKTRMDYLAQYRKGSFDFYPSGLVKHFERRGISIPPLLRKEAGLSPNSISPQEVAQMSLAAGSSSVSTSSIGGNTAVSISMKYMLKGAYNTVEHLQRKVSSTD